MKKLFLSLLAVSAFFITNNLDAQLSMNNSTITVTNNTGITLPRVRVKVKAYTKNNETFHGSLIINNVDANTSIALDALAAQHQKGACLRDLLNNKEVTMLVVSKIKMYNNADSEQHEEIGRSKFKTELAEGSQASEYSLEKLETPETFTKTARHAKNEARKIVFKEPLVLKLDYTARAK